MTVRQNEELLLWFEAALPPPAWLEEWKKTGKMPKDRKVPITPAEFWVETFGVLTRTVPALTEEQIEARERVEAAKAT